MVLTLGPGLSMRIRTRDAGAVPDRGEVDDHRHVLVAAAGMPPAMLIDTDHGDTIEPRRVVDQHPPALGKDRVVAGFRRHPELVETAERGEVRSREVGVGQVAARSTGRNPGAGFSQAAGRPSFQAR